MDRLKKLEFKKYMNIYTVICLCALCAGVNIFFLAMKNGGFLIVADDFNAQQIPFTVALHKQIVEYGIDSWMWNLDLGTSTIHGMGFYELGSPFFWSGFSDQRCRRTQLKYCGRRDGRKTHAYFHGLCV